ncbi:SWIM-type domain-containing protein [Plasmodiophora brassicae]
MRRSARVAAAKQAQAKRQQDENAEPAGRARTKRASKSEAGPGLTRAKPARQATPAGNAGRRRRAVTDRLYLVGRRDTDADLAEGSLTFIVLGTTGNVYYPTLSRIPNKTACTCIDQRCRKGLCKHLLFILIRVLKVRSDHPVVARGDARISASELESIYAESRGTSCEAMAPSAVCNAFVAITGNDLSDNTGAELADVERRPLEQGDECPICFEAIAEDDELDFCRASCRRSVHVECFTRWAAQRRQRGEPVSCVYCRAAWVNPSTTADAERAFKRSRVNLERFV